MVNKHKQLIPTNRWLYALGLMGILSTSALAEEIKIKNWRYTEANSQEWTACRVPGLVQEFLIEQGKLPNPHYRQNEKLVQGVEEKDWIYEADIDMPEVANATTRDKYILTFKGIDTYSTIYLNGKKIGDTENMFIGYEFDVTPHLQRGKNTLRVHLHSPIRMAKPLQEKAGINYPADNDHAEIRYSPFTRKAPYSYGWDWGMRFVTMGIWQPVRLEHYEAARLQDVHVQTKINWIGKTDKPKSAVLSVGLTADVWAGASSYKLTLLDAAGKSVAQAESRVNPKAKSAVKMTIEKPELWQPAGWGKPYLYKLRTELLDAKGKVVDSQERQVGFREVQFVNKPDAHGTSFYFIVNKHNIFARGANYIPGENILTKRTDAYFKGLFDDIEFANMNMIRVWGGGVYEDERFYNEADRRGILIWQDFIFGCTPYPADKEFLANVKREAVYQVKRLRHRPSIIFWCGNNEIEEGLNHWGWEKRYTKEQFQQLRDNYDPLFRKLLPEVLKEHYPEMAYIHGSPISSNWGNPETWKHSDVHYWGLWYGKHSFEHLDEIPVRFSGEYGFQSFPDVDALRQFVLPEDMGLETDVMRQHQKATTGNSLIREYMQRDYRVPSRFEDFVYVGQILQARGMAHMMRGLRRHRPICQGSLYWQLNDAWASVSWSSVDYYQNYKAMHYAVREAYAPLALLPRKMPNDVLEMYLANDYLQSIPSAKLSIVVKDFSGKTLHEETKDLKHIKENASSLLASLSVKEWTKPNVFIDFVFTSALGKASLRWYGMRTKELALPAPDYALDVKTLEDGTHTVRLTAKTFLKDAFLSVPVMGARWSDNLFDLAPGETREVSLRLPEGKKLIPEQVLLRSMGDIK